MNIFIYINYLWKAVVGQHFSYYTLNSDMIKTKTENIMELQWKAFQNDVLY